MQRWNQCWDFRRRSGARDLRSGDRSRRGYWSRRCRCWNRRRRGGRRLLGTHGVPRLRRGGLRCAGAQLLARCFASPCAGVDLPHDIQPLLGFGLGLEESHMEAEALASFLETTAHEKGEALELGQLRLRERHRRRRRAQIEDERPRLGGRDRRFVRVRFSGREICRRCHKFPGQSNSHWQSDSARNAEGNALDHASARSAAPPS